MRTAVQNLCHHCHELISDNKVLFSEYEFCCHGCKTVFQILSENNLCEYYELDSKAGMRIQSELRKNKYDFLEKLEFRAKFVKFSDGTTTHTLLSIPQMHCRSCLWLLERLYKINDNIISTQVYYEKKEIYIVFDESKLSLPSLVAILASIGYEPSLNLEMEDNSLQTKRTEILKIGISGFCFANIMMLSLPEYFSSGLIHEVGFRTAIPYILVTLSLPILFYTASDFFTSAIHGLRKGILNIDLPVSIAIIITFLRSMFELYQGSSNGYLDSMSGIVFFMLIGRWLQNRTHNFLHFNRNYLSYFPIAVEKIKSGIAKITPIQDIEIQDIIKIYTNEIIPVDSILSKGEAIIDYSFVNGESTPVPISIGEHIYAGGRQMNGAIELVVMKKHSQSQLTSLWNHYSFSQNKDEVKAIWTDKIGIYFTMAVLLMSGAAGTYWYTQADYTRMWNSISTVLIVACPCALLLASSFTYGQVMRILSQYKFYVRNYSILDKLYAINHVVFDKTGTLTYTDHQHVRYEGKELSQDEKRCASSLLSHSSHPLSKGIFNFLNLNEQLSLVNFKEEIGRGLEGWVEDRHIKIGSDSYCELRSQNNQTHVNLIIDNVHLGTYFFSNVYRHGISSLMKKVQKKYAVSILSGDSDSEYETLRKIINPDSEILFNQSPIQKLEYIERLKGMQREVLMIGDGLNDAGAFQSSAVAIALTEKNNFFNPSSDIILDAENFPKLNQFLEFIFRTKTIIYISFGYSILYNIIGLFFALRGVLSPVIAAILMPISSISIILFIHLMTEYYHRKTLKTS